MRTQRPDTTHCLPEEARLLGLLLEIVIIRQHSQAWLRYPCQLPV
jgi:hypothetical protein